MGRGTEMMVYPEEGYAIRGAIYEVQRILGAGFLEEVYQEALEREFTLKGIPFEAQKVLKVFYKGEELRCTYRPDFVCWGKIIVELKAVGTLLPEHKAQVLNYLRVSGMKLGFLVNFAATPKAEVLSFVV